MSFRSREAKRKKKAAASVAQAKARATGSSRSTWWLTLVTRDCCCSVPACRAILRVGRPMVYRKEPCAALCEACAIQQGIRPRPSVAWSKTCK